MKKNKLNVLDLAYIGAFAALMAVCSWISIPTTVPFTLQTLGVFLAISLLGGKRGFLSVLVYILLGAVGFPVFSGFKGGLGAIIGTTGGYIVGFLLTALVSGLIMDKFGKKIPVMMIAMLLGLIACYALGTVWFMYVYAQKTGPIGLMTTLGWCVFPFILPDCIKLALAILIEKRVGKYVK
ncbi:MAG: biotin transporter BioY [Acetatifactor sp.]|nr:biotin transporter BioY [Acetatifactor sp.]